MCTNHVLEYIVLPLGTYQYQHDLLLLALFTRTNILHQYNDPSVLAFV